MKKIIDVKQGHFGINGFHNYHPEESIEKVKQYLHWEATKIANAGITWNRTLSPRGGQFSWNAVERKRGEYDFSYSDALVEITQEKNISILALIQPVASWDQIRPRRLIRGPPLPRYVKPQDMDAWGDFLSRLVERYDGDGVNDMPNLKQPIKYWEIGNEPESPGAKVEDYIETLKKAREAIKGVDPDAQILNGGACPIFNPITTQLSQNTIHFWDGFFTAGGGDYIDIFNIHYTCPEPAPHISKFVEKWSEILKKHGKKYPEIWLTEAFGTYSGSFERHGKIYPEQSEKKQAMAWVENVCYALTHGITRMFWCIFYNDMPGWFERAAFLRRDKTPKLIFTTQKILTSKIDCYTSNHMLGEGKYEFIVNDKPVYILRGPGDIPNEVIGKILVTDIYGTEKRMSVRDLDLTEDYIFVELIE